MSFFSQNNFLIKHEYRDFYSQIQRNTERIGDVGEVSDDFKNRSFKAFQNHDFHTLAQKQDSFIAPDEMYGTTGREKNRNHNRMEYDMPERHDGKEHAEVMEKLDKTEVKIKDVINRFEKQGYTVCNTAHSLGTDPIEKKDYDGQMR